MALVFAHELEPARVTGVLADGLVGGVEIGLVADERGVGGKVRAHKVAVLRALQCDVLQAQLKASDFIRVHVGHQPRVGVRAVVALLHDGRELVDIGRVLHGLARADELGNAVRIEAKEVADGGLRDHHSGIVLTEVVAAVDDSGHAVHENAMPGGGRDVEDNVPARARRIIRPVVVRDHGPAVARVAPGGDERAAMFGDRARCDAEQRFLFVVPVGVIRRQFRPGV